MSGKKRRKTSLPIKDAFRILNVLFAAILVSACSREIVFPASDAMPTAEAVLRIDALENQEYEMELNVYNIPEAERITASNLTYVVWMVTRKDGTVNIGPLDFSSRYEGSLEYLSAYEPVRVFVTEEDNAEVVLPSPQIVLDSKTFEL